MSRAKVTGDADGSAAGRREGTERNADQREDHLKSTGHSTLHSSGLHGNAVRNFRRTFCGEFRGCYVVVAMCPILLHACITAQFGNSGANRFRQWTYGDEPMSWRLARFRYLSCSEAQVAICVQFSLELSRLVASSVQRRSRVRRQQGPRRAAGCLVSCRTPRRSTSGRRLRTARVRTCPRSPSGTRSSSPI